MIQIPKLDLPPRVREAHCEEFFRTIHQSLERHAGYGLVVIAGDDPRQTEALARQLQAELEQKFELLPAELNLQMKRLEADQQNLPYSANLSWQTKLMHDRCAREQKVQIVTINSHGIRTRSDAARLMWNATVGISILGEDTWLTKYR